MFDSAGYVRDKVANYERVCWVFRNWDPAKERIALMLLTFRAPRQ